jgi:hypothetical protein
MYYFDVRVYFLLFDVPYFSTLQEEQSMKEPDAV